MTGITRVSKESIFSDLNHLKVATTTSDQYADCFGFTEEVFAAMDEMGYTDKIRVKKWYEKKDIYNPWSYWANTSSNSDKLRSESDVPEYDPSVVRRSHRRL